jgi:hypothetical protein
MWTDEWTAIRIVMGIRVRESCRKYFRKLKILPLKSQYSLSLFVINNRHHFETNSEFHNVNTRIKYNLHHPLSHLSIFQKGVYYTGIKVFNNLPLTIKDLSHNIKEFNLELGKFLLSHSFYMLGEYFKCKN